MTPKRLAAAMLALAMIAACGPSADELCDEYRAEFVSLIVPASDSLVQRAVEVRSYQQGEIELSQLTEALASSEAEMEQLLVDIEALGEPPERLAESVALITAGFSQLRDAFGLDDGLGFVTDPVLYEQYSAMTDEGVALVQEGSATLTCRV